MPEVAAGAAPELDAARAACTDALGVLAAARPDLLVVVGPEDGTGLSGYPAGTPGTFRGFGVDLDVRLGDGEGEAGRELPYGLAVGAWLLGRTGWADAPLEGRGVGSPSGPRRASRRGAVSRTGRTGWRCSCWATPAPVAP